MTRRFVEATAGSGVQILDTRKTTPGMRIIEKYAVRCGGGHNHRLGLFDRVMIKDNHLALWQRRGGEGVDGAIRATRDRYPGLLIEVEVEKEGDLDEVLAGQPDWVLLDNMAPAELATCAARCRGICKTEASGGITLETIGEVVKTGVDAVSLGTLTHSAPATDLSLEMVL